jgi:predicted Zn-dependent protease
MLSRADMQRLLERVMALVKATKGAQAIASLRSTHGGNTRFAVNEITSSSLIDRVSLGLTVQFDKRSASATTNQLDDRSLDDLVGRVVQMAKLAPENPEQMPPLGAQTYRAVKDPADPATAQLSPEARAKAVGAALAAAQQATLAGFYGHEAGAHGLATTAGLAAYRTWTTGGMSCTARTQDGTGSGWAGGASNRASDIDAEKLAKVAVDKAMTSQKPRRLDPGKYTVVLEPAAVADLLAFLVGSLNARRADEGRSYFGKKGTKIGDKLFPDTITLRSDPTDARLAAAPFDDEGFALQPTKWLDKGALTGLVYGRYWAQKQGKQPTGQPDGWTLDGGTASRDDLIKGVKRGVLITRFWYLRMVDPQTILVTGLTRDGVFLIDNGAVAYPINNFRFNESPVQMLSACEAMTAPQITVAGDGPGFRVPALRTHDFNLASISEAV